MAENASAPNDVWCNLALQLLPWGKQRDSHVQKLSVALTPEIIAMVKEAAASGEYTSTSEVAPDALRSWKAQRTAQEIDAQELRRLWQDGLASGPLAEGEAVFGRLRDKYARKV